MLTHIYQVYKQWSGIISLIMKRKFGKISKSLKILRKWLKIKCITLSNLKLLLLRFFYQLSNTIDKRKNRIKNIKEVNICKFLCLHFFKSMELGEKTELLRRLSVYALSKIHLDRYNSYRKFCLCSYGCKSYSMEFQMRIWFMYFRFMIVFFLEMASTII